MHFFEGPEKKIEFVVRPGAVSLRSLGRAFWEGVVHATHAQILSAISNDELDAYLLSESSLFVYDDRATLITCGQTTLVNAVEVVLGKVPVDQLAFFIYERKNEHFPHLQKTSFFEDALRLKALMPGVAFRFGEEDEHHLDLFALDRPYTPPPEDRTLEVLMHGIDKGAASIFYSGPDHHLDNIRSLTGITEILPGFAIDDYVFEPHGYSLNAIRKDEYYTVHVTPQELGSYVSFETNQAFASVEEEHEVIARVLGIFKPRSCDIIRFLDRPAAPLPSFGYQLRSQSTGSLRCGFHVSFSHYFEAITAPTPPTPLKL